MPLTPQTICSSDVIFLLIRLSTFVRIPTFSLSAFGSSKNDAPIKSIAASVIAGIEVFSALGTAAPIHT